MRAAAESDTFAWPRQAPPQGPRRRTPAAEQKGSKTALQFTNSPEPTRYRLRRTGGIETIKEAKGLGREKPAREGVGRAPDEMEVQGGDKPGWGAGKRGG